MLLADLGVVDAGNAGVDPVSDGALRAVLGIGAGLAKRLVLAGAGTEVRTGAGAC